MKKFFVKIEKKIVPIFDKIIEFIDKNKIATLISFVLIVALIFGITILVNSKKQVNSSSNLSNLGFSININGKIYYIGYNEGRNDGIYTFKGKNKQKISDEYGYYLNKSGRYIYYLDTTDMANKRIVKMKTNGNDKQTVIENVDEEIVTVKDGYIYYFANAYFYRVKTNGENKKRITNKSIENYQIVGNSIYYSYKDNGKYTIAKMKTTGDDIVKIDDDCGGAFFVKGNNIYYIYENKAENGNAKFELYKIKTDGKNKKKVADIEGTIDVATINFINTDVFYAKKDQEGKYAIYKMSLNGKKETKVVDVEGYVTKINIHDNYIYYPDSNDNGDVIIYKVKTNGKNKQAI